MNIRVPFSVNIMLKIPQRFGYAEVRFFDERVLSGIITEPADGLLELHGWASRSLPLFPGGVLRISSDGDDRMGTKNVWSGAKKEGDEPST